jgi:heptaprenyl diphosphate synthase
VTSPTTVPAVGPAPTSGIDLLATDPALEEAIRVGLEQIEIALHEVVAEADPSVTAPARHLLDAGGKRFRPTLTLLAAQFGDPSAPGVVPSALVVELTHLATLYHDDVMDEAQLRRGAPAANRTYGNTIAILTGDFLFARASDIAAGLGQEAVQIQARTFSRLVQGQIRETAGPPAGVDPLTHYLAVVADKTGSLVATAARFGGLLSGAPAEQVAMLKEFGEQIGTVFQLADDLLDVSADRTELGKQPGTDLREGVRTLPVLLALAEPGRATDELSAALAGDLSDDRALDEALRMLQAHPGFARAREFVGARVATARALLDGLPDTAARSALDSLAAAVASRTA